MAINYKKYINSKTTHYISNSGSDERGKYQGGTPGDQTGTEWQLKAWYSRPWTVVLRYPDANVGMKIAELGIAAALNNKIGYDQATRTSYWKQLQKVNYDPSKITVACNEDCTAGVTANTKAAGYLFGLKKLQAIRTDTYSVNMKKRFVDAGFVALTAKKYLSGYQYLMPGDILLCENHHAATNITMGSKATPISAPATPVEPESHKSEKATGTIRSDKGSYHIRIEPNSSAKSVGVTKIGEVLPYLGESKNGWNKVQYKDAVGWISSKAGDIRNGVFYTVKTGTWYIREKGNSTANKVTVVLGGSEVLYMDEFANGWKKVYFDGYFGWISENALKK